MTACAAGLAIIPASCLQAVRGSAMPSVQADLVLLLLPPLLLLLLLLLSGATLQVKMVSPQEVQFASDRGALIVDVRPEADYDAVSDGKSAVASV
jgi:hypothetical protein